MTKTFRATNSILQEVVYYKTGWCFNKIFGPIGRLGSTSINIALIPISAN
jgi:hypothetical protein